MSLVGDVGENRTGESRTAWQSCHLYRSIFVADSRILLGWPEWRGDVVSTWDDMWVNCDDLILPGGWAGLSNVLWDYLAKEVLIVYLNVAYTSGKEWKLACEIIFARTHVATRCFRDASVLSWTYVLGRLCVEQGGVVWGQCNDGKRLRYVV